MKMPFFIDKYNLKSFAILCGIQKWRYIFLASELLTNPCTVVIISKHSHNLFTLHNVHSSSCQSSFILHVSIRCAADDKKQSAGSVSVCWKVLLTAVSFIYIYFFPLMT